MIGLRVRPLTCEDRDIIINVVDDVEVEIWELRSTFYGGKQNYGGNRRDRLPELDVPEIIIQNCNEVRSQRSIVCLKNVHNFTFKYLIKKAIDFDDSKILSNYAHKSA